MSQFSDPRFVFIVLLAAFVVVLLLTAPTRRGEPNRTCRQCGAVHATFARFCRRCGRKL